MEYHLNDKSYDLVCSWALCQYIYMDILTYTYRHAYLIYMVHINIIVILSLLKHGLTFVHNSAEKNVETGLETHCDTCLSMRRRLRLATRLQERLPSIVDYQKVTTAGWNRGGGGLHRPRALEWKKQT